MRVDPEGQGRIGYGARRRTSPLEVEQRTVRKARVQALRDVAIIELLAATGPLPGEVCALSAEDSLFAGDTLRIRYNCRNGATPRTVSVPNPRVGRALGTYLCASPPGSGAPLFRSAAGSRLTDTALLAILQRLGHGDSDAIRAALGRALLSRGTDVRLVKSLLGHGSITTTLPPGSLHPGRGPTAACGCAEKQILPRSSRYYEQSLGSCPQQPVGSNVRSDRILTWGHRLAGLIAEVPHGGVVNRVARVKSCRKSDSGHWLIAAK